ncbi:transposase [Anoxybacillus gonensis]|nr:transposase [Anoxybacillus gonensis]
MINPPPSQEEKCPLYRDLRREALLLFSLLMHLLILHRRHVLISGMNSLGIIKTLNVFKNPLFRFFACRKGFVENEFLFNDAVKRFRTCVVITVSLSTHARLDSVLPQHSLVFIRCILAPLVRMVNQTWLRILLMDGPVKCFDH